MVLVNDGLHYGQTNTCARLVITCLIERVEYLCPVILADTCPIIFNDDAKMT